ncbi:MAG: phosphatidic acid phosphatase, partial [Jatrophihabitantaceae bacterium]
TRRTTQMVTAGVMILASACAVGLVAGNYHYATDVIGGIGVATSTVLILALLIDAIAERARRRD